MRDAISKKNTLQVVYKYPQDRAGFRSYKFYSSVAETWSYTKTNTIEYVGTLCSVQLHVLVLSQYIFRLPSCLLLKYEQTLLPRRVVCELVELARLWRRFPQACGGTKGRLVVYPSDLEACA